MEKKIQKLDATSLRSLETLLKPFKENLDTFKKSVENSQESSIKKFAELSKEIELVARAGMSISQEAENLAKKEEIIKNILVRFKDSIQILLIIFHIEYIKDLLFQMNHYKQKI